MIDRDHLWGAFSGHEPVIAAFLRRLVALNVDPRHALDIYDARIDALLADAHGADQSDALLCPHCGAALELQPLCPQVSPHWRTALACSSDACLYHGLSTHPLDYLLRHGAAGNVEER